MSAPETKKSLVNPERPDLTIAPEVFASLPPLYKSVARLLQKEGRVQIVTDAPKEVQR
jgi:hypothetical protein